MISPLETDIYIWFLNANLFPFLSNTTCTVCLFYSSYRMEDKTVERAALDSFICIEEQKGNEGTLLMPI